MLDKGKGPKVLTAAPQGLEPVADIPEGSGLERGPSLGP